jgi:hypothetical protein
MAGRRWDMEKIMRTDVSVVVLCIKAVTIA